MLCNGGTKMIQRGTLSLSSRMCGRVRYHNTKFNVKWAREEEVYWAKPSNFSGARKGHLIDAVKNINEGERESVCVHTCMHALDNAVSNSLHFSSQFLLLFCKQHYDSGFSLLPETPNENVTLRKCVIDSPTSLHISIIRESYSKAS